MLMVCSPSQRPISDGRPAGREPLNSPLRGVRFRHPAPLQLLPARLAAVVRTIARPVIGCTLVVLLLLLCATVSAGPRGRLASFKGGKQTAGRGNAFGIFSIKPRVLLEPVTAAEITGMDKGQAVSCGGFQFGNDGIHSLNLRSMVSRKVSELWRLRMPVDARLYALDVSYELVGANGRSSRLCNLDKSESEIKVQIDDIPPRVVGREANSMLIEGGMVMHLQLEGARAAGKYSGTLTVVVNHF
jgi:hypothetical protein